MTETLRRGYPGMKVGRPCPSSCDQIMPGGMELSEMFQAISIHHQDRNSEFTWSFSY